MEQMQRRFGLYCGAAAAAAARRLTVQVQNRSGGTKRWESCGD